LEKFKNSIWKKIIESNTNIKLPDILTETENSINVYEQKNGELSVVLHNSIDNQQHMVTNNSLFL
ncbi:MAG: hypothetical protein VW454_05165, partial [Pelagibacteraceae bacterium]